MTTLVCITDSEWRNLCSTGNIRVCRARLFQWDEANPNASLDRLFALAPHVNLNASTALLIVKLADQREEFCKIHPAAVNSDVCELDLRSVSSFHPLNNEARAMFEHEAEAARVTLGEPIFEKSWINWIDAEDLRLRDICGRKLAAHLGQTIQESVRDDGSEWRTLAELMLRRSEKVASNSSIAESLPIHLKALVDQTLEDHGKPALYISGPVVWMRLFVDNDILQKFPDEADFLAAQHARLGDGEALPPQDLDAMLAESWRRILGMAPDAFSDELTPEGIAVFIELFNRIRAEAIGPDKILNRLDRLRHSDDDKPVRLVAYLLGVELGPEKLHSIDVALRGNEFAVFRKSCSLA